ncbi:phenylacetate 2-hydroxylase [Hortaea werneckii]|nr:phenylacetate 2-hydroxylase [Hortaea werneckii]
MERLQRSKLGRILDRFAVESDPGLSNAQLMLTNEDLKPVEPERRIWRSRNFVAFWIADCFNINTWMISASNVQGGLSWASFGIWGSLWPVINRAVMACIWYGVQSWIGGTCVRLMISSIWRSWDQYDGPQNTMPASSGTNTRDFVSFFLFWLGSLPFLWFPVYKIRHLFTVKSFVAPAAGIAFFIWAIVAAGGLGPIVKQPSTIHGSERAWAIIKGIMSAIANFAALIVNNPDFARFARRPKDALWSQLITIPVGFALTSFIGIIASSSSTVIFGGDPIWDPLDLLQSFLEQPNAGGATRFGVFVIAAAFTLAQLGTNIAANSISAGTDMTALLPRWISIRRGSYICAGIGIAMCPWHLLSSSNNFTTYLSAYSVFLSSIAGVMVCDYYAVRKGYLQTRDLYSTLRSGPYHYTFGVHWRAYAAYIAGILINVVGFAGAVGNKVPKGATYIYNLNFFCGFLVAALVYYALCWISPVQATSPTGKWLEVDGDESERSGSLVYGVNVDDAESTAGVPLGDSKAPSLKLSTRTSPSKISGIYEIPGALPIVGHLLHLGDDHASICEKWWRTYKHSVFQIRLGNTRAVVINSFEDCKRMLLGHQSASIDRPTLYTFHGVISSTQGFTIGSSPWDDSCKNKRKAAGQTLGRPAMRRYHPMFDLETLCIVRDLVRDSRGDGKYLEIRPYLQRYALNTTLTLCYGIRMDSVWDDMLREVLEVGSAISLLRSASENYQDYIPILRYMPNNEKTQRSKSLRARRDKYLTDLLDRVREKIQHGTDKPCVSAAILKDEETKLTEVEVSSICLSLVSGGFETIPGTLTSCIGSLSTPEGQVFQERAYQDIKRHYPKIEDAWKESLHAESVPYVNAIVKEAGRYYTVSSMSLPRRAYEDIIFDGARIPKGTMILINAQAANHSSEHFGPDADKFNPERWLSSLSPPEETPTSGIQHFSFGAGSRACSGQLIATRLLYTALVRLICSFKIVASETEPPNVDYVDYNQFKSALVAIPRDFKVNLIPRDVEATERCMQQAELRTKDAYY